MSNLTEKALQSLTHPTDPEFAYAFAFKDYLAKVSAHRADIARFMGDLLTGVNDGGMQIPPSLPLQVNALGVLSGRTEFDEEEADYYYDAPEPEDDQGFQAIFSPFSIGVPSATYIVGPHDRYWADLTSRPDGVHGQRLALKGGFIALRGQVGSVPDDFATFPGKTEEGYLSSALDLDLEIYPDSPEELFTSKYLRSRTIVLARAYSAEAEPLDRPYSQNPRYRLD